MMERRAKLGKRGGTILPAWEKWVAAALAKATTDRPASAGELAAKLGLSGKLSPEPTAPAPAPASRLRPWRQRVAASLVATAPETTTEKAPEAPKQTALDTSKETPTPAETPVAGIAAITGAAAVAAAASSSKAREPEPAAAGRAEDRASGAWTGHQAAAFPARRRRRRGDGAESRSTSRRKSRAKSRSPQDDDDRECDSKVDADSDKYEDPAPTAKSSTLVFGGLIMLVAVLAYLLNRPGQARAETRARHPGQRAGHAGAEHAQGSGRGDSARRGGHAERNGLGPR